MPKRVLVTGASGFIGRLLCEELQSAGSYVIATGTRVNQAGPWHEYHAIDFTLSDIPSSLTENVDTVFHLAGKAHALSERVGSGEDVYEKVNYLATMTLLEQAVANNVRAFVFFSTVKVFGETSSDRCRGDIDLLNPETPYARSKLKAELSLFSSQLHQTVALRLSMVYGPGSKGNLYRMINAIRKGYFPSLGVLNNRRSMVHVADVVRLAMLSARNSCFNQRAVIITDGQLYSTSELYQKIRDALGKEPSKITVPVSLLRLVARVGDLIGKLTGRRFPLDSYSLDKLVGSECYINSPVLDEIGFHINHKLDDYLQTLDV